MVPAFNVRIHTATARVEHMPSCVTALEASAADLLFGVVSREAMRLRRTVLEKGNVNTTAVVVNSRLCRDTWLAMVAEQCSKVPASVGWFLLRRS